LTLLRKLSAIIVVLAFVAVACSSGGSTVIASVGGTDITEDDLGVLFESSTLPIDESFRSTLFGLIAREVLLQGLATDFGLELDQDEVESTFSNLIDQMEEGGMTPEDFLGLVDASVEMIRFNAEIGVLRQQVIDGSILLPEITDAFFSDEATYTNVCVRHVLVETAEETDQVITRLEGGEDFGDVATELSLDTGTPGGDLGCSTASRYVDEFAEASLTADVGTLVGPVETQFGFHVLLVYDRSAPTRDEVQADPKSYLTEVEMSGLWSDWFNEALRDAEVTLDEKYGFWSPVGIIRPDQPHLAPDQE